MGNERGGPVLITFTDEQLLDELARRLAKRVLAEERAMKPNSLDWREARVKETLLGAMVGRTLEEMDAPVWREGTTMTSTFGWENDFLRCEFWRDNGYGCIHEENLFGYCGIVECPREPRGRGKDGRNN